MIIKKQYFDYKKQYFDYKKQYFDYEVNKLPQSQRHDPSSLFTYCCCQGIDGAKKGRFSDGRHDSDCQRHSKEHLSSGDILKKTEENVRRAGQECSVKEEVARANAIDILSEDWGEENGRDEYGAVNLKTE